MNTSQTVHVVFESECFLSVRRKTTVKMLCIYADYKSDESYTPSKISVRVGNNFHNLQEIRVRDTLTSLITCVLQYLTGIGALWLFMVHYY